MSAQSTWAKRLNDMEAKCPWPGPRPIRGGEALLGRRNDLEKFVQVVSESRLVILDGKSGVGKSSLLVAGLIPRMERAGYTVAYSLDWQDDRTSSPLQFLAQKVLHALQQALRRGNQPTSELAEELADPEMAAHPEDVYLVLEDFKDKVRTVIVLDQFEELIRYSEVRAGEVLDEIAVLNKAFDFNIVISLRSEYLHELRRLEKGVRSFGYATYELVPVESTEIAKVIRMSDEEASSSAIDAAAVQKLCDLWDLSAVTTAEATAELDSVGLLHLQALLHNLFWSRVGAGERDARVTLADVDAAVRASRGRNVFTQAIQEAVDLKLNRCSELAEPYMDDHLRHGLRAVIARSVPHLSSAGYKLHREVAELAAQALSKELEVLIGERDIDWHPLARALLKEAADAGLLRSFGLASPGGPDGEPDEPLDLFTATWFEIIATLQSEGEAQALLAAGKSDSPIEIESCGPMAWLSHDAVVAEELRRFAVAMMWLAQCSLVRITAPSDDRTMVSLVHDRFGEGLKQWADRVRSEPASALHAITAPRGEQFIWRTGKADLGDVIAEGPVATVGLPRVLANLRWGSAFIRADFKHIVFANCDFRGPSFRDARCKASHS